MTFKSDERRERFISKLPPAGVGVKILHLQEGVEVPLELLRDVKIHTIIRYHDNTGYVSIIRRKPNSRKLRKIMSLESFREILTDTDIFELTYCYKGEVCSYLDMIYQVSSRNIGSCLAR